MTKIYSNKSAIEQDLDCIMLDLAIQKELLISTKVCTNLILLKIQHILIKLLDIVALYIPDDEFRKLIFLLSSEKRICCVVFLITDLIDRLNFLEVSTLNYN